jgi:hypothetical protein
MSTRPSPSLSLRSEHWETLGVETVPPPGTVTLPPPVPTWPAAEATPIARTAASTASAAIITKFRLIVAVSAPRASNREDPPRTRSPSKQAERYLFGTPGASYERSAETVAEGVVGGRR